MENSFEYIINIPFLLDDDMPKMNYQMKKPFHELLSLLHMKLMDENKRMKYVLDVVELRVSLKTHRTNKLYHPKLKNKSINLCLIVLYLFSFTILAHLDWY